MSAVASARGVSLLADPTRASILGLMLATPDGRVLVGRVADALGLRQPTVSHHVKALLDEGIVTREPSGRQTWYAIAPDHRDRVRALFEGEYADGDREVDLALIVDNLAIRLGEGFDRRAIQRCVADTHRVLSRVTRPKLVASRTAAFAADRLDGDLNRPPVGAIPEVLIVCVKNAGRSQIAAAILRYLAGGRIRVRTAGSAPDDEVRSSIVIALDEIGIPLGSDFPKPLTDDAVRAADTVITMGCGDVCRRYPGATHFDWEIADPVGRPLPDVRIIRDEIDVRVRRLLSDHLGG